MKIKLMMSAMLGVGLVLPSFADRHEENGPPKDGAVKTRPALKPAPKRNTVDWRVGAHATRYNVSEGQVKNLRAQGLLWGEIRHALSIAKKAGVPVSDVMKLRDSGMGWGKIAQSYGFKLGHVNGQKSEMRREKPKEIREDRNYRRESHKQGHDAGGLNDGAPHVRGGPKS